MSDEREPRHPTVTPRLMNGVWPDHSPGGPLEHPLAISVSIDERAHIDMLLERSYALAVARGHMRR